MDTSLVKSTRIAVDEMVKFLMARKGLTRMAAYQLASVGADLRITQLVDGNVGVHMMVEKSLLQPKR
jgi:acetamidase/formamidase